MIPTDPWRQPARSQPELISTLTTVRNGAPFIAEAVGSLLAQTDGHFEVIVVDDGSTDRTQAMLNEFQDPRLRVVSLPPTGRVEALNRAVAEARGELLAVLDADDVALPLRLATQRAYLEKNPDVWLVGCRAIEFGQGPDLVRLAPHGPAAVRRALGMYNPFYFSSVFFRRAALQAAGGFRIEDGLGYDMAFLVRTARAHPVEILDEPLVRYRRHAAQMTASAAWEVDQRRKSAAVQLWAAAQLGLHPHEWIYPLGGWLYASLPVRLRPRRLKEWAKQRALRLLGVFR